MADPVKLLLMFAEFLGPVLWKLFQTEHPELFDVESPEAPPRAPASDLDPEVERLIKGGGA